MTCLACAAPAHPRKSAHGLCIGHALIFLAGPWYSLAEFLLWRESR